MGLGRRRRIRMTLTVILCLLFQQVAVAAYLCPLEQPSPAPIMVDCHDMGMEQQRDPQNPALCAKHCAPDIPLATDAVTPSVPPLALPPVDFTLVTMPPMHSAWLEDVSIAQSDPPPRVRFCSLLI